MWSLRPFIAGCGRLTPVKPIQKTEMTKEGADRVAIGPIFRKAAVADATRAGGLSSSAGSRRTSPNVRSRTDSLPFAQLSRPASVSSSVGGLGDRFQRSVDVVGCHVEVGDSPHPMSVDGP